MRVTQFIAKAFLPDDESWLKHANPWSVWTRFITLPFLVLAVWSRAWIGWYCLIPISILVIWIIFNPRLFGKPASFDSWGSRAVLGERFYINEYSAIPVQHKPLILILIRSVLQTISGLVLAVGLWELNKYNTLYGMALVYLSKMWFLDRMVWLYEDTRV